MPNPFRLSSGAWKARKRIPDDVREDYARLHGPHTEATRTWPASTKPDVVKREFCEWLAVVEKQIETIRAARDGTGISLTKQGAAALAGEWYDWFTSRRLREDDGVQWVEHWGEQLHETFMDATTEEDRHYLGDKKIWLQVEDVREAVRPVIADAAETAQFLASKGLHLNNEARVLFLDQLWFDFAAAKKLIEQRADGDYSPDKYAKRFPKFEGPDSGETPQQLFEKWVGERKPAGSTVESWRYVFRAMTSHFLNRSAASISPDEAAAWISGLVGEDRSAQTVKKTWLNASSTIFSWAVEHKHVRRNPFADVKVTVPKQRKHRETKAFRKDEQQIILREALAIDDSGERMDDAAKRWVPWLCAYTGARPGEMTQLRGSDVVMQDGINAIRITPEAGTVKTGEARVVPIHQHLIDQGFLKFVARRGQGPLFYKPRQEPKASQGTKGRKAPYAQVRQRLAAWVRSIGVDDKHVSPNHGWRHTFKQIADRAKISERTSDYITGHAHRSEGARYGAPTLSDMAEALKKFPRYEI